MRCDFNCSLKPAGHATMNTKQMLAVADNVTAWEYTGNDEHLLKSEPGAHGCDAIVMHVDQNALRSLQSNLSSQYDQYAWEHEWRELEDTMMRIARETMPDGHMSPSGVWVGMQDTAWGWCQSLTMDAMVRTWSVSPRSDAVFARDGLPFTVSVDYDAFLSELHGAVDASADEGAALVRWCSRRTKLEAELL